MGNITVPALTQDITEPVTVACRIGFRFSHSRSSQRTVFLQLLASALASFALAFLACVCSNTINILYITNFEIQSVVQARTQLIETQKEWLDCTINFKSLIVLYFVLNLPISD
jgi:hypothetical protein